MYRILGRKVIPSLPSKFNILNLIILLKGENYPEYKLSRIKSLMTEKVDQILEEMSFGPGASDLYSTTGCKRVGPKVDMVLEDTLLEVT